MDKKEASEESEKSTIINVDDASKKDEPRDQDTGFKDYLRIFTYSDKWDWTFNIVGAVAAIASGTSLALYV